LVLEHIGQVMSLIREGTIGSLELVEIQCTGWDIINAGIHWLDFCVALLAPDRVEWVMAACDTSTRTYRDSMQVETMAVTYAQTEARVRIVMQTGDYVDTSRQGKDFFFRLVGARGICEFYGWESSYWLLCAEHPGGKAFEVPRGTGSAHQRYLDRLALQIDGGAPDYVLPEHSLAALEVCEAAYLSCQHRCQVTLPLSEFTPPSQTDWTPGKPYRGGGGRDGRKLP
jgi:predicted dehydrogenase